MRFAYFGSSRSLTAVFAVPMLGLLTAAVPSRPAQADIITFNNLPGNNSDVFTTFTEGAFTVSALSGDVRVAKLFGNPVPDIFGNGPFSVQVTRTGNTTFTFSGVDLATGLTNSTSDYTITGFLGANQVLSQSGTVPSAFTPVASSGPLTALDRLVIAYTRTVSSSNIDNINVTAVNVPNPVPEPSEWLAMGMAGTSVMGLMIRARRRKSAAV